MTNTSIGAPASLPVDGKARQFLQMAVQREPLKLPQELVDIIINDLQDDMPTLCCCTLVSREWVFSARRHLFRHVTVYMIRDSLFFMRDTPPSITHNLRYLTLAYGRLRLHDFAAVLSRFPSLHLLRLDNLDIQQTHQSMFIDRRIIPCCTTQLLLDRIALNPQLLELILLYVHASELRISRSCQLRRSPRYYATYAPTREYKLSEDLVDTLRAGHKLERIDLDHQDACELIAKTMQRFPIPLSFSSASFRWIVSGAGRSSLEMVLQGCGPKLTSVALDLTTFYHGSKGNETPVPNFGLRSCPNISHIALKLTNPRDSWGILKKMLTQLFAVAGRTQPLDLEIAFSMSSLQHVGAFDVVLAEYVPERIKTVKLQAQTILPSLIDSAPDFSGRRLNEWERAAVEERLPLVSKQGVLRL